MARKKSRKRKTASFIAPRDESETCNGCGVVFRNYTSISRHYKEDPNCESKAKKRLSTRKPTPPDSVANHTRRAKSTGLPKDDDSSNVSYNESQQETFAPDPVVTSPPPRPVGIMDFEMDENMLQPEDLARGKKTQEAIAYHTREIDKLR